MTELPQPDRELERFVARRMLNYDHTRWKELTVENRKRAILIARRALRAERAYFARQRLVSEIV